MSDAFVPEADALDQQREVAAEPLGPDDDAQPAIDYPKRIPIEAPESDVLEQAQAVDFDDEDER
ncbi:MAG TPA: hypothetical protein VFV02_10660 [Acidimicrobiales bacterium]|nr:hypothetical protein [Acidimicrobiales bacterium]